MRRLYQDERGFIARGGFAVFLLVIFTIAMLVDVLQGNFESFGQWLTIIAISAVLTVGLGLLRSMFRR